MHVELGGEQSAGGADDGGGGAQFAAASVDPRIDTLIPLITWNDLSYSVAPNNVVANGEDVGTGVTTPVHGAAKMIWVGGFLALGVGVGVQHADVDPQRLLGCPDYEPWACSAVATAAVTGTIVDNPTFDALQKRISTTVLDGLRLPGASLLVVHDGTLVEQEVWGSYTLDTVVPIASASKWLSAAMIMTLVEDGVLDALRERIGGHWWLRQELTMTYTAPMPADTVLTAGAWWPSAR